MLIRLYKDSDELELTQLLISRNIPIGVIREIPAYGLVAISGDKMVAYGGLRQVEGCAILLDGYITNPGVDSQTRNEALDRITLKALKVCKHFGVKNVIAFTSESTILTRAIKHGFILTNSKYLTKKL